MRARELVLSVVLLSCSGTTTMPGSIGVIAKREANTGRVVVVDVPTGSAGARAGLERGDEIVTVDGALVYKMTREEFSGAVRGPAGSKVMLEIRRNGLTMQIVVQRIEMRALDAGDK